MRRSRTREPEDLHEVGTEVTVAQVRMPDGSINVWVQGQRRVRW